MPSQLYKRGAEGTDEARTSLRSSSGIMSFGSIILQGIMNTLGVQAVTAITSAYRLDSLAMLPAVSMASAVSTFTAQNMGCQTV